MFKPLFVTERLNGRVCSLYKSSIALNSGGLVDIDFTDTSDFGKSLGQEVLLAGSLKLATVASTDSNEFGISLANCVPGGVPLVERLLGVATNFFALPTGLNVPVYQPLAGDIIATTEYVGNLAGDVGATGLIDPTQVGNYGAACGIISGRFRLKQAGDKQRAILLGMTTLASNGPTLAIFKYEP